MHPSPALRAASPRGRGGVAGAATGAGDAATAAGDAAGLGDRLMAGARCGPTVGVGVGAANAALGAARLTSSAPTAARSDRRIAPA